MKTYIKKCKHGEFILIHGDLISEYLTYLASGARGKLSY